MILRPYEIVDAPIFAETFNDPVYRDYWRHCSVVLKQKDFENIEQIMGLQVMVVEDEGKIIGFLTGKPQTETTIFTSILILKDSQKSGYAREMIELGLDYLKEHRFHKVAIRINPENKLLETLCRSMGFIEEGYFKEERWSAEGWKDERIMALFLENR